MGICNSKEYGKSSSNKIEIKKTKENKVNYFSIYRVGRYQYIGVDRYRMLAKYPR